MEVQRWIRSCQVSRETSTHRWVDQFSELTENQFSEMLQRESRLFQGRGDLHSLEITSMMDSFGFSLDQRIVGSRVHFDSQRLDGAEDVFETWSDPLSSSSVESERRQREEVQFRSSMMRSKELERNANCLKIHLKGYLSCLRLPSSSSIPTCFSSAM